MIILDENYRCMPVNHKFEMSNLFNLYFCQQTQLYGNNMELPISAIDHNDSQCTLENIVISMQDVIDNLQNLNNSKASGPVILIPLYSNYQRHNFLNLLQNYSIFHCKFQRSPPMESRKCYPIKYY